jgi:hypothetical protein
MPFEIKGLDIQYVTSFDSNLSITKEKPPRY